MIDQEEMAQKAAEEKPETISVKEFAAALGWDISTVNRAINSGRIKTTTKRKPGLRKVGEHRILKSELDRLLKEAESAD